MVQENIFLAHKGLFDSQQLTGFKNKYKLIHD